MKLRILSFQALALGAALLFLACPPGNITTNQAPIVNAGAAPTATVGTAISITATATDVDGNPLTYEWAFDSLPAGSSATLSGATSLTVSFTPDVAGSYVLRFTASDGQASSSATVTVTAANPTPGNTPPVIAATSGQFLQQTGRSTTNKIYISISDVDGNSITASASISSVPEDLISPMKSDDILLENISNGNLWFLNFNNYVSAGIYGLTITASDGTDTVSKEFFLEILEVEVEPTLSANVRSGPSGTTFSLTGRVQNDCELDEASCAFVIMNAPNTSTASLGAVTEAPSASPGYIKDRYCAFTPMEIGEYVIQYQVKEGDTLRSASITLTVFDSANGGVDVSFK